ncbi:hypothetical protein VX037_20230 [Gordonia sp. Z-3]|uniref:hypothetical protein n=1 Tax=Gordonia sp. Z-3 TaxID=3115408 RepID=UPI002E2AEDDE|nr:hypothetical protein [Gordonia sp. Z-3]MED5803356.1 hypothetical protein [Gordonia sp. Z-3]
MDLSAFVRFLHVEQHDIDDAVSQVLLADDASPEQLLEMYMRQLNHQLPVTFHEGYHYWQGLRLPYLHRHAVLMFMEMTRCFVQLARTDSDWHRWAGYIDSSLPTLGGQKHIWFDGDDVILSELATAVGPDSPPNCTLSALDLVETAASLAEFQVLGTGDSRVDPIKFGRWAKRHPTYRGAYDYVSRVLGDRQLALRCTLPMINASFETTDPVRTFCSLGRYLTHLQDAGKIDDFVAQDEPCQWGPLFRSMLDAFEYDAGGEVGDLFDTSYYRVDLDNWVNARLSRPGTVDGIHPIITSEARAWSDISAAKPFYGWLLDQPGWLSDDQIQEALRVFSPITIMRLHAGQDRDRVIPVGRRGGASLLVSELLMIQGAVRRAAGESALVTDSRLCCHAECPEYVDNYCNNFVSIPQQWSECKFPERMKAAIERMRNQD